jgi:hypothetical protein
VPEELGLEERFRQAGAVDGDEGALRARAVGMDGAGHQLLADAALARDQHLRVGPGDALDFLAQLQHRVAAADEVGLFGTSHK